jgi:hypothetical protein
MKEQGRVPVVEAGILYAAVLRKKFQKHTVCGNISKSWVGVSKNGTMWSYKVLHSISIAIHSAIAYSVVFAVLYSGP